MSEQTVVEKILEAFAEAELSEAEAVGILENVKYQIIKNWVKNDLHK